MNRSLLKRLWLYPFRLSSVGENLYEWLTAVALGTQRGMSRKWCLWFREHVVLCRRYGKVRIPGQRVWLFEPGWSLAPVILAHLVTDQGPLVTEPRRRLAKRYVAPAVAEAMRVAEQMLRSVGRSRPAYDLLGGLSGTESPLEVLRICEAEYRVGGLPELEGLPPESVHICMSMGRLEHFDGSELRGLLSQMRRVLAPQGVGSHIVDHRDHLWHFDRSRHCFRHLTYSDEQWAAIARGRKLYRNRLVGSDYVRMFEDTGFEVIARVHELHRHDADGLDPETLWGPYRELRREDLEAAVSHFIVRRR